MKIFQRAIAGLVSFQILFGSLAFTLSQSLHAESNQLVPIPPANVPPLEKNFAHMQWLIDTISRSSSDSAVLPMMDNYGLRDEQGVTIFKHYKDPNPSYRNIGHDVVLGGLNVELEEATIGDPLKSVRILYDDKLHRLIIAQIETTQGGETLSPKEIYFTKVVLSTQDVDESTLERDERGRIKNHPAITVDPNVLVYSTKDGIKVQYLNFMPELFGKARIPQYKVLPPANAVHAGANIEAISFYNPTNLKQKVRKIYDFKSGAEITDKIPVGSLLMETRFGGGETKTLYMDYRAAILLPLEAQLPWFGWELYLANPTPEGLALMQEVQAHNELASVTRQKVIQAAALAAQGGQTGADVLRSSLIKISEEIRGISATLDAQKLAGTLGAKNSLRSLRQGPWQEVNLAQDEWSEIQRVTRAALEKAQALRDQAKTPEPWNATLENEHQRAQNGAVPELNRLESSLQKVDITKGERFRAVAIRMVKAPQIKYLVGALLADTGNYLAGGKPVAWLLTQVSHLAHMVKDTPLLGPMAETIAGAKNIEAYSGNYALSAMTTVLLLSLALRPLSYWAGGALAKIKGENWDDVKAFFTYGLRAIAHLSFPAQRLVWEKLLLQKNVYEAKRLGMPLNTRSIWRLPSLPGFGVNSKDSGKDQPGAENTFNADANNLLTRRMRAMVLASAMVSLETSAKYPSSGYPVEEIPLRALDRVCSEENLSVCAAQSELEGTGLDPAHLMMLLQSGDPDKFAAILEKSKNDPELFSTYEQMLRSAYAGLVEMGDKGVGDLDPKEVLGFYKVLRKMAKELLERRLAKSEAEENPILEKSGQIGTWLRETFVQGAVTGSKYILDFIVFCPDGYEIYRRYRNAVLASRNQDNAAHQYDADYDLSALFFVATAGYQAIFGIKGEMYLLAFIGQNQLEQVALYGLKGGLENDLVNPIGRPLHHPGSPWVFTISNREEINGKVELKGTVKNSKTGKEIPFWTSVAVNLQDSFTPGTKNGLLQTQLGRMYALRAGLQTNILAGAVWRAMAIGVGIVTASKYATMTHWSQIITAIPQQLGVLFGKYSFFLTPNYSIAMGYAVVWAFVFSSVNRMKDRTESGAEYMKSVDFNFDYGLKFSNLEALTSAIDGLKAAYSQANMELPEKFQIESSTMAQDPILVKEFWDYSKDPANVPLYTVPNSRFQWYSNMVGALVSSVIAVSQNTHAVSDASPWKTLGMMIAAYAVTFVGVKTAVPIWDYMLRALHVTAAPIKALAAAKASNKKAISNPTGLCRDNFPEQEVMVTEGNRTVEISTGSSMMGK